MSSEEARALRELLSRVQAALGPVQAQVSGAGWVGEWSGGTGASGAGARAGAGEWNGGRVHANLGTLKDPKRP